MKKALKSLVIFAFTLAIIMSTMSVTFAAPGSFTLKASATPTSVTLSWTKSDGADKYVVQQYKGRWKDVKELSASTTSYTIKKLKTGESYTYRIKAVEDGALRDTSTASNKLTVTPAVQKVSSFKASQYNYNTVKLSWKKQSGVTGYQIFQYNAKTKKWSKVKTVSSKYDYAYIKSLKSGTTYKFRIRAYLKSGKTYYYSAYSSTASVKAGVPATTVKTTTSYNAVKLSWSKVKDANGYRIYRYDSASKKWVIAVKSTTKTAYTFKDLKTGTSYSFRVVPYQKVSKKVYWGSYKTIKATPTLAKPTGFKELPSTLTTLSFKWNKVSGAAGYRVYKYNTATKKWDVVLKATKDTSFTDTKLKPGTQYSYKVKAYRKVSGKYFYSPASSTFKTSTEVLNTVSGMRLLERTQTSVTLSWDDINADGYEIYTASGSGVAHVSETKVTIGNLTPGTTYKYKMKAYFVEDGVRIYTGFTKVLTVSTEEKETEPTKPTEPSTKPTEPSTKPTEPSTKPTEPSTKPTEPSTKPTESSTKPTEPSTKPTEPSTKPTEPSTKPTEPSTKPTEPSTKPTVPTPSKVTGLQKTDATETSIFVKWNASTSATGYKLSYRAKGTSSWTEISTKLTSYNITGLTAGTQYEIKVTAVNGSTSGTASDVLTASTVNPPVAPLKVTGLQKVSATETTISIKWSASSNATSYMLNYRAKGAASWTERSTNATSYEITGLTAGTQYEIKVTAANSSTTGPDSDVLTVSTASKAPEAAEILSASTIDENQIKLSWDAISGAATYDLQYYSSTDNEWQIVPGANNLTARTFTDSPSKKGRAYCGYLYRVIGRNSLGNEVAVSNAVTGTTKGLTVTQDKYQATITWDKISGAKSYSLLTYVKNLGSVPVKEFTEFTANSATLYLAPGDIHSFTLISNNTDGTSKVIFSGLSVITPELDISDNSDKGVNAKLLYLERAINRTKYLNDEINVVYDSVSDYEINYVKSTIPLFSGEYSGVENVQKFFDKHNDDSSEPMMAKGSDKYSENINFRYGSGKNAKGKTVYLKYILEPATNADGYYLAYIYDGQKPQNWKNGFSTVDVKENADGSYDYTVVIKKENLNSSSNSLYHKGLFESVGSVASGMGAEIKSASVGATTIKAKIGPDGVLQTYQVDSPFNADMVMAFELSGVSLGSINMKIQGNGKVNYIFTK